MIYNENVFICGRTIWTNSWPGIVSTMIFVFLLTGSTLKAQYHLSGSSYVQDFNDLQSGMPFGWQADTNATAVATGGPAALNATPSTGTRWNNAGGGFKNVASANGFTSYASGTAAAQLAAADRALGIRQTGSFGDPGAAFTFQIDNTYGLTDFELDLKMQTLDSNSSRSTDWLIQYAIGDSPSSFHTVATYTSGGNKFENQLFAISFGTLLDDQREKVWIRVVTLIASSGAGSRTTTAIDDVKLSWKGIAVPGFRPLVQHVFPANGVTDVRPGSILSIRFSRFISIGSTGSIRITNKTDHSTQTIAAGSAFLHVSGKELLISGVRLAASKTYHITFDSSIVDTAGAMTYALEDTNAWRFTTAPSIPAALPELFDTACASYGSLPSGWTRFSVTGAAVWNCMEHTSGNHAIQIYGHDGTGSTDNEDWLITPLLDLSSPDVMAIAFSVYKEYSGTELSLLVSEDYAGSGPPDSASWTNLPVVMSAADANKWVRYIVPLGTVKSRPFYLAFKYLSHTAAAYDTRVDSVSVLLKTAISEQHRAKGQLLRLFKDEKGNVALLFDDMAAGDYEMKVCNSAGQELLTKQLKVKDSGQRIDLGDMGLPPGLYVFRLKGQQQCVFQKVALW